MDGSSNTKSADAAIDSPQPATAHRADPQSIQTAARKGGGGLTGVVAVAGRPAAAGHGEGLVPSALASDVGGS